MRIGEILDSWSHRRLAWSALPLAAIILLSVNILAKETLQGLRADVTGDRLFTISSSTREVLASLEEPVRLKYYRSAELGDVSPSYARHAERVRALLRHYAELADGKLVLDIINPEPFSDEEDQAVAAGLQAVDLGDAKGQGYLGIIGDNSIDTREVIPFLALERQNFLEYDLTKLIHKLAQPERRTVGLISSLPLGGGFDPQRGQTPPWLIYEQIAEFFSLETIEPTAKTIPAHIDIVMLAAPGSLSRELIYALDQFALNGKPVLALLDPFSEVSPRDSALLEQGDPLHELLSAWGARIEPQRVVGERSFAQLVRIGAPGREQALPYVVWQALDGQSFDDGHAVFSSIDNLTLASAGALFAVDGGKTTFHPLIQTTPEAMLIDATLLESPDPQALLELYRPGGERLTLAAQLSGRAMTAFPDGPPSVEQPSQDEDASAFRADGEINVFIVVDADFLFERFWAQQRDFLGQRLVIPMAGNADFIINALEVLSGGPALTDLRGRGVKRRPFTVLQNIKTEAETRYRQREQALNAKLEETQARLLAIQNQTGDAPQMQGIILSDEDKKAIVNFRQEILTVRKDLRDVQRALHQDIESLSQRVKIVNIIGVPLAIGLFGFAAALWTRQKNRRLSSASVASGSQTVL